MAPSVSAPFDEAVLELVGGPMLVGLVVGWLLLVGWPLICWLVVGLLTG